jgi:hypothetical protein
MFHFQSLAAVLQCPQGHRNGGGSTKIDRQAGRNGARCMKENTWKERREQHGWTDCMKKVGICNAQMGGRPRQKYVTKHLKHHSTLTMSVSSFVLKQLQNRPVSEKLAQVLRNQ